MTAPQTWAEVPPHVQRWILRRLFDREFERSGGTRGLLRILYNWTRRPDGTRVEMAHSDDAIWQFCVEDAERFAQSKPPAVTEPDPE